MGYDAPLGWLEVLMRVVVVVLVVALTACGKSASDPTTGGPSVAYAGEPDVVTAPEPTKADPATAEPAKVDAGGKPSPDENTPTTIGGRMQSEREDRTHEKPEVEDVLAAFEAAGLKVAELRQGVARTSKARFCMYGSSPSGHRVLVCEHKDVAEAEVGAKFAASQLVDPRRVVEQRGRLSVTILLTTMTPEGELERTKYLEAFAKVVPAAK